MITAKEARKHAKNKQVTTLDRRTEFLKTIDAKVFDEFISRFEFFIKNPDEKGCSTSLALHSHCATITEKYYWIELFNGTITLKEYQRGLIFESIYVSKNGNLRLKKTKVGRKLLKELSDNGYTVSFEYPGETDDIIGWKISDEKSLWMTISW